ILLKTHTLIKQSSLSAETAKRQRQNTHAPKSLKASRMEKDPLMVVVVVKESGRRYKYEHIKFLVTVMTRSARRFKGSDSGTQLAHKNMLVHGGCICRKSPVNTEPNSHPSPPHREVNQHNPTTR
ncbi:hypothetical protein ATANTOWER_026280, partial [Ataeniobius toweri]|nr:hypothetical protein [Ataeniobius toweri]